MALALGDAGFIFLPIGRRIGVCFTQQPEHAGRITPLDVTRVNRAMWRDAVRFVATRSTADSRRPVHV